MASSDGTPERANVAARPVCPSCADLSGWEVGRGPAGLTDRVNLLLGLAAGDDFDEIGDRRSPSGEWVSWSEIPPEDRQSTVLNGPYPPQPAVDSAISVRCRNCRAEYTQAWAFERGYESWTIRYS